MATSTTLISSVTVGAGSSSVTFSSIPGTYTDLLVRCSVRVERTVANTPLWMRVNGDTSSNYSMKLLYGDGSAANTLSYTLGYLITGYVNANSSTSLTYTNMDIYIPNYAGSTQKSISVDSGEEDNATGAIAGMTAGLWTGTSAITSLTFLEGNGPSNIRQYSNFYLYGIKNS